MTLPQEPEARGIGACLNDPSFPASRILERARMLADFQSALREWAGAPLAASLRIANERDGTLVVFADSASAATVLRYRQQELVQFLRRRNIAIKNLEVKNTRP